MDKISNDVRVYTDVQGLENLRAQSKTDPNKARKEVAQQFESLLFQMVMRSMRDANNALASDLFSSNDMSFYQDMFDKQLSLALSTQGVGFAQMIETNLDQQAHAMPDSAAQPLQPIFAKPVARPVEITQPKTKPATITANKELVSYPAAVTHFNTPRDFMNSLWGSAKRAAKMIGVHPSVLMAQAALETNWGKKIIGHIDGASTHNLFNIKSDPAWAQKSATTTTLEQKNGVLVKETANFRSYGSFDESFSDYANMIKSNPRYRKAAENADTPAAYTKALQEAGYATDSNYSNKIMGIINSPLFKSIMSELNLI